MANATFVQTFGLLTLRVPGESPYFILWVLGKVLSDGSTLITCIEGMAVNAGPGLSERENYEAHQRR